MDAQGKQEASQRVPLLHTRLALDSVDFSATVIFEDSADSVVCAQVAIQDVPSYRLGVGSVLGKLHVVITSLVQDINQVSSCEAVESICAVKGHCNDWVVWISIWVKCCCM